MGSVRRQHAPSPQPAAHELAAAQAAVCCWLPRSHRAVASGSGSSRLEHMKTGPCFQSQSTGLSEMRLSHEETRFSHAPAGAGAGAGCRAGGHCRQAGTQRAPPSTQDFSSLRPCRASSLQPNTATDTYNGLTDTQLPTTPASTTLTGLIHSEYLVIVTRSSTHYQIMNTTDCDKFTRSIEGVFK